MAQRTIYECDRCHTEWELDRDKPNDFPPQWAVGQSLGMTRFILCETCAESHRRFLEGLAVEGLAVLPLPPPSAEEPPLLDEADHTSDETAP
jgi:DNA-directed RNA polymerase subunit RPC12/RpoP